MKNIKENRLAREKSPYLLQHAHNPVDWFAWEPAAFEKAQKENKLIFLSIGYSTCHWCHVMEHESFENQEVAELLNKDFISIKVDREERPDIDHLYMSIVQAMTGSGGWPLTVFLTPDAKPVTGGTYFPPEDRWGRPGMKTILPRLTQLWKDEKLKMQEAGKQWAQILARRGEACLAPTSLSYAKIFETAEDQFKKSFDPQFGGFDGAPKFPRTHDLSFLLHRWGRSKDPALLNMVEITLEKMFQGGIYDHAGGGFHRYATDGQWQVPHFEKMLYDQASLASIYIEAHSATGKALYRQVAEDIFHYVLRDMTSPEGGFYSAEDADSEGEEGKFYVWRPEEIEQILGKEDAKIFNEYYGVTGEGNFEHGTSILHIDNVSVTGRGEACLASTIDLQKMRQKVFEARKKRIPPLKDDKILTAWNGMMIIALAQGARVTGNLEYKKAAMRSAEFILKYLQVGAGHAPPLLLRRFRENESAIPGFQDDYAFMASACLELYETTLEVKWLLEAKRLTGEMIRLFWDASQGGFFYNSLDGDIGARHASPLLASFKEYYDGATASGNSMAALLLMKLARMTGESSYETKAQQIALANAAALEQQPVAFSQMLIALDFATGPTQCEGGVCEIERQT